MDTFNNDFEDFIRSLNQHKVEYILIGGYAVILHGYWRSTGDLDIWVKRTEENYLKLTRAYYEFGLPLLDMTKANFLSPADFNVFTYGIPPVAIDVLTEVKGLEFASAFENSVAYDIDGLKVNVLSLKHLIEAKKASNRPRDQDDIQNLLDKS